VLLKLQQGFHSLNSLIAYDTFRNKWTPFAIEIFQAWLTDFHQIPFANKVSMRSLKENDITPYKGQEKNLST